MLSADSGSGVGVGVGQLGGIGVVIIGPSVISNTAPHDWSYLTLTFPGTFARNGQFATSMYSVTGAPLIVPVIVQPDHDTMVNSASRSRSWRCVDALRQSNSSDRMRITIMA